MRTKIYYFVFLILFSNAFNVTGQGDGLICKGGKRLFPIGWYFMPKEDEKLKEMADAGINVILCNSKEELDRALLVGLMGWMPLNLQDGVTEKFKEKVNSVVDHPALAIWEGPDEIAHHITAWSGLYRDLKVHEKPGAWGEQTPGAVKYAKEQSKVIIPNLISAISFIRSVDPHNRQIWINEAAQSDVGYVRQYLDFVDITGCDRYPVSSLIDPENTGILRNVDHIKFFTQRWMEIGRGKPVYMVLQAHGRGSAGWTIDDGAPHPSFVESRYMAYISIAYGARGINYWGDYGELNDDFRQSLYALISELAALQPFLVAPQVHVRVKVIADKSGQDAVASCFAGRSGHDWMIAVINETDTYQMGVVIENLKHLNGMKLIELYNNDEEVTVSNEEIVLRMKPREVKVLASDKKWETTRTKGRVFPGR